MKKDIRARKTPLIGKLSSSPPLMGGDPGEGDFHPLPIPLPSREREFERQQSCLKAIALFLIAILGLPAVVASAAVDRSIASLEARYPTPITLNLVNVDIRNVLQVFSRMTGINVVISDEVSGLTTVRLNDVSPVQALESILRSKGYNWYMSDSNTVVVTSQKTGISQTFVLKYANAEGVRDTLSAIISQDLASISVNTDLNAVVVKGDLDTMHKIRDTIETLDIFPQQVVLEAHIIELKLGNKESLGVKISQLLLNSDVSLNTANVTPSADITSGLFLSLFQSFRAGAGEPGGISSVINALKNREDVNLIASPTVMVQNHKEAKILVGDRLGFRTATTTSTTTTQQIQYLETGTNLRITPHINEDGFIRLILSPKVSTGSITTETESTGGQVLGGLPQEHTTEASTEVIIADGQTLIIGGLVRDESTETRKGIPFLMDIPFIGLLFRNQELNQSKREVVIFMTPRLFSPAMAQEMKDKIQSVKAEREKNLEEHQKLKLY